MNVQNHLAAHALERSNHNRHLAVDREFDLNSWDLAPSSRDAQVRRFLNPVARFAAALIAVLVVAGTLSL